VRKPQINPYEVPNYTIEESARYLHVHSQTVTYWVIGTENMAPLSTVFTRNPMLLSFKNLVECFVLESLRKIHGMSLQAIRHSVEQLRIAGASKYPLADYDLHTERGRLIYLDENGKQLTCVTHGGQMVFRDMVMPFLKRVERNERGIAKRLFPFTGKQYLKSPTTAPRCVVIDPNVAFGMPVLINSRISTAFLLSRKKGGASVKELATDYGRSEAEIEEAIRLEEAA
jgi:uncharacterized protein (DUF433 family)